MKVFKGDYSWTTVGHNKLQNGEDLKYYMPVQFMRGQEPLSDSIDITPTRWWLSCYLAKDGTTKPKLFVAEWEQTFPRPQIAEQNSDFKAQTFAEFKAEEEEPVEQVPINIDDLPFY